MPSLSTPTSELQSEYGVIVVGSGYGGAIAAYRMADEAMAQANGNGLPAFSVCLLERGIERQAGDFPSTFLKGVREMQADTRLGHMGSRTGLFDFRTNKDVSVLVGCGLGGTSLINAGVMVPPTPEVLKRFPGELGDQIKAQFNEVKRNLGVSTCPPEITLEKVKWLQSAGTPMALRVKAAPVSISFKTHVNAFDMQVKECVLCGSCISGCNHSAKNTVAMNYLPGAAGKGAAIFCGVETRAVERGADGWWVVHARLNDKTLGAYGNSDVVLRARMVFLAAGTLGSTEILLRSRDAHRLDVSDKLGFGFSGNGDVIAFGYNTPDRVNGFGYGTYIPPDTAVGPTIAAVIDDRSSPDKSKWMMIEEGAIPGALRLPLRFGAPLMARMTHRRGDDTFDFRFKHIWREIDSVIRGAHHGALARTQTFLAMADDDGNGEMKLSRDRLRIIWTHAGYRELYTTIARRLQSITRAMKGRYVINPFWSRLFGRRLLTVHPLGGCCVGNNATDAVVDPSGQVFTGGKRPDDHDPRHPPDETHPHLYVCDGSIIPKPLATNPALTISAFAEHVAQTAVQDPAVQAVLQQAPTPRTWPGRIDRSVAGIQYAERLRGKLWLDGEMTRLELVLRISAESVEELLDSPAHTARIVGVVRTPDLPEPNHRWTVTEGTLNVLVDDPVHVDAKLLVYRLKLTNDRHRELWLRGHKVVSLKTLRRHLWAAVTRVPFVLFDEQPADRDDEVAVDVCRQVDDWDQSPTDANTFLLDARRKSLAIAGAGTGRNSLLDAVRLFTTMRVVHERSWRQRFRLKWRYRWYFFKTVFQLRVWAVRHTRALNPFDVPLEVERRSLRLGNPIKDTGRHSPRFLLTRYKKRTGGSLGPVLLAPGFGMSTFAFHAAGDDSIAEFLHRHGYDVWLFDYRVSDELAASLEQFDIDVLAREDFPDAIRMVYDLSGKRKVRVVAHCVGSLTMQMSLLSGRLNTKHLHSMLLSQSFAFIDLPWPTRVKVRLHLPELLKYFNFRSVVTSDYDLRSGFWTRAIDRLLYFFPSDERCGEGVCRRLLLLYGEVARHDQLDKKTHDMFYHLFDRGNLTAFRHIGRMFIKGRISDKDGNNAYLRSENGAHVDIPITLLQGAANRMFLPSGGRKTHEWLVRHGGFGALNEEMFTLVRTPRHGHLDSIIGRNAKAEVFPKITEALADMSRKVAALRVAQAR